MFNKKGDEHVTSSQIRGAKSSVVKCTPPTSGKGFFYQIILTTISEMDHYVENRGKETSGEYMRNEGLSYLCLPYEFKTNMEQLRNAPRRSTLRQCRAGMHKAWAPRHSVPLPLQIGHSVPEIQKGRGGRKIERPWVWSAGWCLQWRNIIGTRSTEKGLQICKIL